MADYIVTHTTRYKYDERVSHCHNIGYLMPQTDERQKCSTPEVRISPAPASYREHSDYFGNRFCYFSIEEPHDALEVTGKTRVTTQSIPLMNNGTEWERVRQLAAGSINPVHIAALEFTSASRYVTLRSEFAEYAKQSFTPNRFILDAALDLTQRIHRDFKYEQKSTTILTPLTTVFEKKKGVCQDFAHFSVAALRSLGLAARYVSGYIETLPPVGKEKLKGSDASHAWFSVFVPSDMGGAWYDFDPTNGKAITEEFIVTARGRDFGDVSPLKGILFGGGKNTLKVEVDVQRVT